MSVRFSSYLALVLCGIVCCAGLLCLQAAEPVATPQAAVGADAPDEIPPLDFNRDIRPILSDRCFHCHGPDSAHREAGLRLDREADAKDERDGTPAIVPGKPEASEFIRRITSTDEGERMPPDEIHKPLSAKQIELLRRWVAEGAVWALPWTYVAPTLHPLPKVRDAEWPLNWIDNFILSRLEREKLKPSPEADKVTLIRRLSVDLTGLPPTSAEVDAFLADKRPQAYEALVDRLLASPHYGERMAVYWLDLVRYADTVGYHGDQEQHISPYRDYVIGALNANMPFDRFTREQLAGDLLDEPTLEQKIATGYNRLLQTSHEGGVQAKEYLAIYAADRVRNLSAVWMGGTMGCAQCHDHKFDPYTSRDFYSMQAFFADIDEANHLKGGGRDQSPTIRAPEMELPTPEQTKQLAKLEKQREDLKQRLGDVKDVDADDLTPEQKTLQKQLAKLNLEIDRHKAAILRTMITVAIEPRPIRVLPRGNWMDDSGEIVPPMVPEFFGKLDTGDRRATRLDLASWLTNTKDGIGGLTSRVMVNRFWYLTFGVGLARVLDDFGGQGEPPVHPKLLDNLAVEFVESSWDVKHMLKLIVMSRTYRQSSIDTPQLRERDPLNRLYAHQSCFRYPAEVARDSTLAISGLLVDKLGGPSVKPYQPPGYYRHLNFPIREYEVDLDSRQWRRGVYVHWQRQYLHPMLKAFDAPSREECTAERPRSNTALAALVLLNDPTFVEAARSFAVLILQEGGATTEQRLAYAFLRAVSHQPDEKQQELLTKLLDDSRMHYDKHSEQAAQLLMVGLKPIPEGMNKAELAAWTIVARTILSMHETLTRN